MHACMNTCLQASVSRLVHGASSHAYCSNTRMVPCCCCRAIGPHLKKGAMLLTMPAPGNFDMLARQVLGPKVSQSSATAADITAVERSAPEHYAQRLCSTGPCAAQHERAVNKHRLNCELWTVNKHRFDSAAETPEPCRWMTSHWRALCASPGPAA